MYSQLEIENLLKEIKKLIQCKRYRISTGENREKNEEFIFEFDLNDEKICELLMQIEYSLSLIHISEPTRPY